MSTEPRTIENFPRMKNRAAGRAIRRMRRSTVEYEISFETAERVVDAIVRAARHASDGMVKVVVAFDSITRTMQAAALAVAQNLLNA